MTDFKELSDKFHAIKNEYLDESIKKSENTQIFASYSFQNKRTLYLFFLFSCFSLFFTYFLLDKRFFTDNDKLNFRRFFLTSLIFFFSNLVYIYLLFFLFKRFL